MCAPPGNCGLCGIYQGEDSTAETITSFLKNGAEQGEESSLGLLPPSLTENTSPQSRHRVGQAGDKE